MSKLLKANHQNSTSTVFLSRPHQLVNIKRYLVLMLFQILFYKAYTLFLEIQNYDNNFFNGIMLIICCIPILRTIWIWLSTHLNYHLLSKENLIVRFGVLNRTSENIELFRIKDIHIYEPLLFRLFKIGNIELHSSDKTFPKFILYAMKNPRTLAKRIRQYVEKERRLKGVREFD